MKVALVIVFACLASSAFAASLFPLPSEFSSWTFNISIDPTKFTFKTVGQSSDVLNNAFDRYMKLSFWNGMNVDTHGANNLLSTVAVNVLSADTTLVYGVDESYSLSVSADGEAQLNANTVWGALKGLETFSQMVDYDDNDGYVIHGVPIAINDSPRFNWRGFMIDTARHYLSVDTIKHVIDTMVYSKFNVLHWHAVDAQSFPLVIQQYPLLSEKGAYAATAIFDASDVADVVKYAYARGIRVIVELDGPGHAYAWGLGYPDIVATCPQYATNINNIPLDPTNPLTFEMLQNIYNEVTQTFTDEFFHLGGDEVLQACWAADASISSWLSNKGWSTQQLYQYFVQTTHQMATNLKKTAINWQEVLDNNLGLPTADTVIHVWKDQATLGKAVTAGYRALLSAGYYLDQQMPTPLTHYEWEDTWINFYLNEPFQGLNLTDAQKALVLGGEAAMWGEQVDAHNYDSRVWPRACAVGERLWSNETVVDVPNAKARLSDHACRLQRRGVNNGPIQPG